MRVRSTFFAALTLVLAAALAGCGDDDTSSDDSTSASESEHSDMEHSDDAEEETDPSAPDAANVVSVTVDGDTITPEPGKVKVPVGEDVTIKVTSDVEEEVHIHGYDKTMDLEPGEESKLTLTADIPGLFEVELEESGTLLFELQVS